MLQKFLGRFSEICERSYIGSCVIPVLDHAYRSLKVDFVNLHFNENHPVQIANSIVLSCYCLVVEMLLASLQVLHFVKSPHIILLIFSNFVEFCEFCEFC